MADVVVVPEIGRSGSGAVTRVVTNMSSPLECGGSTLPPNERGEPERTSVPLP